MTALTQDRNTARTDHQQKSLGVAAAALIYAGAMVMRNAAGYATKGQAALGLRGVGRAEERIDNSDGAAGDVSVKIREGVFHYANSAGADEITIADIGKVCYAVDDQTVAKTHGAGTRSPAGIVTGVDSLGVDVLLSEEALAAALAGSLSAAVVVGAEAADVINAAIQLRDGAGADLAERASILAYLSDDANGDSLAGTAPSGGVAIGTDGLAIPLVAGKCFVLTSEADGDIDLNITEAGADTWYLVLVMPDGRRVISGAITFA